MASCEPKNRTTSCAALIAPHRRLWTLVDGRGYDNSRLPRFVNQAYRGREIP